MLCGLGFISVSAYAHTVVPVQKTGTKLTPIERQNKIDEENGLGYLPKLNPFPGWAQSVNNWNDNVVAPAGRKVVKKINKKIYGNATNTSNHP